MDRYTGREREQAALPHKAPESNPSQKTKREYKKVKERRQRQREASIHRKRRNLSDRKQYKEKYRTVEKL